MKTLFLIFIFLCITSFTYSQNPCPGTPTVTYSGKVYNTVQIGTQCWLKENLDVGTMIMANVSSSNNSVIEKYCYDNILNNCSIYGGLYQWDEAMAYTSAQGAKGICPDSWHIPNVSEIEILKSAAVNSNNLKAVGQGTGLGAGNNSSGFSALLASNRDNSGSFGLWGYFTNFWISKEFISNMATSLEIVSNNSEFNYSYYFKDTGFSIRCIKDVAAAVGSNEKILPIEYSLSQNYPNPFNPTTTISYQLSAFSHVKLNVYDILGVEVATLVNENKAAGNYNIEFNASILASGIYFYSIQASNYTQTKQMVLIK